MSIKNYLKIARIDHWIKQLFIIPGFIFALIFVGASQPDTEKIIICFLLGFISTSFIASANYVINEWLDAEFDKFHPTKKYRPVLNGDMKLRYIILEYSLLAVIGLIFSFIISLPVFLMEVLLLLMGIIYNVKPFRSKDIPYIDVLSESVNNAIRLLIGWFIVTPNYLPPVSIILGFWLGGAFLMATKRFSEYRMIEDKSLAGLYRKSFLYYNEQSLLVSAQFYGMSSLFFCAIFMIKYKIELLLAIPFLCLLFCLYTKISFKFDSSAQKPEKLFREKGLMLYVVFFIVLVSVLMLIRIPSLQWFLDQSIIKM